jgi:hypothetical protein
VISQERPRQLLVALDPQSGGQEGPRRILVVTVLPCSGQERLHPRHQTSVTTAPPFSGQERLLQTLVAPTLSSG